MLEGGERGGGGGGGGVFLRKILDLAPEVRKSPKMKLKILSKQVCDDSRNLSMQFMSGDGIKLVVIDGFKLSI